FLSPLRSPRSTLFPYTTLFRSLGLRCRREDRRFEAIGLIESGGQSDAAHGAGGFVIGHTGAGVVTASDAFDGQHGQVLNDQAATARGLGVSGPGDMVADDL